MKIYVLLLVLCSLLFASKSSVTFGGSGVLSRGKEATYGGGSLFWGMQSSSTIYRIDVTALFRQSGNVNGGGISLLKEFSGKKSSIVFSPGISLGIWYRYEASIYEMVFDSFTGKSTIQESGGSSYRKPTYFGGPLLSVHWGVQTVSPYIASRLYIGKEALISGEVGIDVNYIKRKKLRKPRLRFSSYAPLLRISPALSQTKEKLFTGIAFEAGVLMKAQLITIGGLISSSDSDGSEFLGITLSYGYRLFHDRTVNLTPAMGITLTQTVANYYEDFDSYQHRRYILSPSITIELGSSIARPFVKSSLLIGQGVANVSQIGLSMDFSKL